MSYTPDRRADTRPAQAPLRATPSTSPEAPEPDHGGHGPAAPRPPRLEWWLMILIMSALTVLTLLNVLVRYFTSASFAYTEEVSVALMVALVLVGASCAVTRNHHIRVTLLVDRDPRSRKASDYATLICTLGAFGALTYYGTRQTLDDIEFQAVSAGLGVPEWWFSIILPLGSALICLRTLGVLARRIRHDRSGRS